MKLKYRGWQSPRHYARFRHWLFHIWNDFDLWTFNNKDGIEIQGVRILGFEWN